MTIIEAGGIVHEGREPAPGWIEVKADRVVAVGRGRPPHAADVALPDDLVAPGFVDVHVHGGGGASFGSLDPRDVDRVLATHLARGTTTMVASLVTASPDALRAQVAALAPRVRAGDLAGIHLEGPWLSPAFKGAHDEALLRAPELELVDDLLQLADGTIAMVTLAPELDWGLSATRHLAQRGVVLAVGHTACTHERCRSAIDAGASGATHLFNAMPPLHHRAPGPVLALLADPRVHVELILDNVHVDPALAASVLDLLGDRGVLITDAMAAAGHPDGRYKLGDLDVEVREGVARLLGTSTIAGSTLTLDAAVRNAVAAGLPVGRAIAAATINPARYLRLTGVGTLAPGSFADLVVLDPGLQVRRVMRRGRWV